MIFIIILFIIQAIIDFLLIRSFVIMQKNLLDYTNSLSVIVNQMKNRVGR